MIWLASFPRSGNTFFRNVLYEVYGLTSSTYHLEKGRPLDSDFSSYPFVKTHLLPDQLPQFEKPVKSVYIVRDGRDALISIAHHRQDFVETDSHFYINLLDAIVAPGGSFFGGWSENVSQWTEKADIVIRFEDLIKDPIGQVERLREIYDLPAPQRDKLPSFQDLKTGTPKYGSGLDFLEDQTQMKALANKSFRKGKVGNWKDEMPEDLHKLFWEIHKEQMFVSGFGMTEEFNQFHFERKPIRVLLDAVKLLEPSRDGVRRYLVELVNNLWVFASKMPDRWEIHLQFEDGIIEPLKDLALADQEIDEYFLNIKREREEISLNKPYYYEVILLTFKAFLKNKLPKSVYHFIRSIYQKLPIRSFLQFFRLAIRKTNPKVITDENDPHFFDVLHVPLPQRVTEVRRLAHNLVVTIHDFTHKLFPQFHVEVNIQKAEKGMKKAIKAKADFISVSLATQADLNRLYDVSQNATHLTYEAVSRNQFSPKNDKKAWDKIQKKYELPQQRFFLCLFTLEPRKNIKATIEAFRLLQASLEDRNIGLWICGSGGWKMDDLPAPGVLRNENIYFPGFIDDEDLAYFYSYAEALCYVSHYEGFGLPPLEAMACGCPVIYGNNSSMKEVIGNAGFPADPNDIEDIFQQMKKIIRDPELRKDLVIKSYKRALQFSWLKMAWETLKVYEQIYLGNLAPEQTDSGKTNSATIYPNDKQGLRPHVYHDR